MPENFNSSSPPPVAVEFTRGGIVECQHRAYVAVYDSDGNKIYSLGDPEFVTFLRSSAKPFQSFAAVLSGAVDKFGFTPAELALTSGSHGGEPIHVETVTAILRKLGLDESALKCGTHPPLDGGARNMLRDSGEEPRRIHHNCSGKHSGMLATAVALGEDIECYLDPHHPVQTFISEIIATLAGISVDQIRIGIDGCSAPVHAFSMKDAATAFARLIEPSGLPEEYVIAAQRIADAARAHPEMIAACQDRICSELIKAGRHVDLIAKGGAEGYYAVCWRDPRSRRGVGLCVKVEDGAQRARDPLVIALLQKFGVFGRDLPEDIKPFAAGKVTNFDNIDVGNVYVRV